MAGERALLLKLSQVVKAKGWGFFLKGSKSKRPGPGATRGDSTDELALRLKLKDYFAARHDGSVEYDRLCQGLDHVSISFDVKNSRVKIACPLCETVQATCNTERSGSWKITNFVTHVKNHWKKPDEPAEKRQRTALLIERVPSEPSRSQSQSASDSLDRNELTTSLTTTSATYDDFTIESIPFVDPDDQREDQDATSTEALDSDIPENLN
ncbi:uncharacterized protein LOC119768657 [Culex quinquefasciatus]|nr:uncharacterized protein LOC119768657 [Culex quinquefasciatus]